MATVTGAAATGAGLAATGAAAGAAATGAGAGATSLETAGAVATGLEEMGYATEVIKAQLSHAKANLTDAAYLRGQHVEKRAAMMGAAVNAVIALVILRALAAM